MEEESGKSLQIKIGLNGRCKQPKAIIEAAHIYTNESPSEEQEIGANLGIAYATVLSAIGYDTKKWLFIDDYNPKFDIKPEVLDVDHYIGWLSQIGYTPDRIIFESELITEVEGHLDCLLRSQHAAYYPNRESVILQKGRKRLKIKNGGGGYKFSCPLLDASFYIRKLGEADLAVTIIPENYQSEQKVALDILKRLDINTSSILPVYFNIGTDLSGKEADNHHQYGIEVIEALKILMGLSGVSVKTTEDLEAMKNVL